MKLSSQARQELENALSRKGLRSTRQREQIYALIRDNKEHPTADDLFALSRSLEPSISLATVYNCLETLVSCGLIREIHSGRPPVRYERNHGEHAHFICDDCGEVFDIELSEGFLDALKNILPTRFKAHSVQLRFQGHAECEDVEHCNELAESEGLTASPLK